MHTNRFHHLVVAVGIVATVGIFANARVPAASATQTPAGKQGRVADAPSAAEFTKVFVAATNRYAAEHADPRRIGLADCVQAAPGRYMCSYASYAPILLSSCHLVQARWTPQAASTITITLAGRTKQCGSLREVLDSL